MLQNIIEFQANHQYVDLKEDLPKPIKLNIPEWYKKLQHSATKLTIKGCVAVMDSLTTGYVLSLPQDIILKNNVLEDNKIKAEVLYNKINVFEQLFIWYFAVGMLYFLFIVFELDNIGFFELIC